MNEFELLMALATFSAIFGVVAFGMHRDANPAQPNNCDNCDGCEACGVKSWYIETPKKKTSYTPRPQTQTHTTNVTNINISNVTINDIKEINKLINSVSKQLQGQIPVSIYTELAEKRTQLNQIKQAYLAQQREV
jgi:hypothetical protein